ncbi:MAG: NAD(P)H-binding protein [Bacteroidales bacterium]
MAPGTESSTTTNSSYNRCHGLIGGHLAELLVSDAHFAKVKLITRRVPEDVPQGAEVIVIDFEDQAAFSAAIKGCDTVFCAVGTTRKR